MIADAVADGDAAKLNPLARRHRTKPLINDDEIHRGVVDKIPNAVRAERVDEVLNLRRLDESETHKMIIRTERLIRRGINKRLPSAGKMRVNRRPTNHH